MQKKITVYLVKTSDKEKVYPTNARAEDAKALLAEFGIEAEIEKEKRVVTL